MIFCTHWFIIAVSIFLPIYWLAGGRPKWRAFILLGFCLIFHSHFAGAAGVLPIITLALITYFCGRLSGTTGGAAAIVGIIISTAALLTYKYHQFLLFDLLGAVNRPLAEHFASLLKPLLPATPPLAISFFAFEFIHYLVEVKRGREPIKNPFHFAAFTIYFPSLVAGPIKRYYDFLPELEKGLKQTKTVMIAEGLLLMASGFFKKMVLADNINQFILHQEPFFNVQSLPERWLFVLALAGRIYFDFSGYTDIALGLSCMLGIKLPINFNKPYGARSIREFWQRWHMSLSFWIRDYIYIPLGGGQHGAVRRILNGLIAFALCGLWHGASWNFVFWGLYHGVGLAINNYYRRITLFKPLAKAFDRLPALAWLSTFLFVILGWLPFFYPLDKAFGMFLLLFQTKLVPLE